MVAALPSASFQFSGCLWGLKNPQAQRKGALWPRCLPLLWWHGWGLVAVGDRVGCPVLAAGVRIYCNALLAEKMLFANPGQGQAGAFQLQ